MEMTGPIIWSVLATMTAAGLLVGIFIHALPPGRIAGPQRDDPSLPLAPLLAVFALAVLAWLMVPAFYVASRHQPASAATQPAEELDGREMVLLTTAAGACGLAVLAVGHLLMAGRWLAPLGLRLGQLPAAIVQGLAGTLVVVPMMWWLSLLTPLLWHMLGRDHPGEHRMLQLLGDTADPLMRWMIITSAAVLAPVFEEWLFRGHLQTLIAAALRRHLPRDDVAERRLRWEAIVFSSLAFAAVHEWWMQPPIFVLSLALGYAYERTGNLWTSIFIHAAFNCCSLAVFIRLVAR